METNNETNETVAKNNTKTGKSTTGNSTTTDESTTVQGTDRMPMMQGQTNCTEDASGETNCEVPEMGEMGEPPEGFDGEMPAEMMQGRPGMMGGGFGGQAGAMQDTNSDSVLHPVGYLALGGASVIIGVVVAYACFSRFFHLKPGATFSTVGRFMGCLAVALTVAIGLMALCYFIPIWAR